MTRIAKPKPHRLIPSCSFMSFVVCIALLTGCWGEPAHPNFQTATAAEQLERLMWQSAQGKNWVEFERHLTPTFSGTNSAGQPLDRTGWIDYWKTTQLKDFSLGDVITQPAGPDIVATYVLHYNGSDSNHSSPAGGVRVVSVWQGGEKSWIPIFQSQTP